MRDQWAIENKLHWHLNVTLGENAHRLRQAQAVENLALVRKMARNLLQRDPTPRWLGAPRASTAAPQPVATGPHPGQSQKETQAPRVERGLLR